MKKSKIGSEMLKFLWVGLSVLLFLGILGIDLFAADELKEGDLAPYSGIIFNDEKSGELLRRVSIIPILEDQISNLNEQIDALKTIGGSESEQVANLRQQISLLTQQLEIERERTKLEHERGEFYKEQNASKDKLLEQSAALNDKLIKEAEKKNLWRSVGIGVILLWIGTVVGALL